VVHAGDKDTAGRIDALVHDPLGSAEVALHEYGVTLCDLDELAGLDGLILAVPHAAYLEGGIDPIVGRVRPGGVLIDVKSVIPPASVRSDITLWSL